MAEEHTMSNSDEEQEQVVDVSPGQTILTIYGLKDLPEVNGDYLWNDEDTQWVRSTPEEPQMLLKKGVDKKDPLWVFLDASKSHRVNVVLYSRTGVCRW